MGTEDGDGGRVEQGRVEQGRVGNGGRDGASWGTEDAKGRSVPGTKSKRACDFRAARFRRAVDGPTFAAPSYLVRLAAIRQRSRHFQARRVAPTSAPCRELAGGLRTQCRCRSQQAVIGNSPRHHRSCWAAPRPRAERLEPFHRPRGTALPHSYLGALSKRQLQAPRPPMLRRLRPNPRPRRTTPGRLQTRFPGKWSWRCPETRWSRERQIGTRALPESAATTKEGTRHHRQEAPNSPGQCHRNRSQKGRRRLDMKRHWCRRSPRCKHRSRLHPDPRGWGRTLHTRPHLSYCNWYLSSLAK